MKKLLILACVAMGALGQAQHWVEYGVNLSLGNQYYEYYEQGETPNGPVEYALTEEGYGSVDATANVGFGVNRARVNLSGSNADNPLTFDYGFASSRYFDSMTFSDPQLNGTVGSFRTTLYMHGSGFFDVSNGLIESPDTEIDGFWHTVIAVDAQGYNDPEGFPIRQTAFYAGEWYKGFEETELNYYGDELNAYQSEATFYFIYGEPIYLDTFLQTQISIDNQMGVLGTMNASIDLGNSAYWGGISALRDAQGNLVTDASYSSSSGFDYRASAVPEPFTTMGFGFGLAGLALRRRQR